jgi:type I restriction enzyme S subunit
MRDFWNKAQVLNAVVHLDALQAEVDTLKRLQAETSVEFDALLPLILDKAFKGEL